MGSLQLGVEDTLTCTGVKNQEGNVIWEKSAKVDIDILHGLYVWLWQNQEYR